MQTSSSTRPAVPAHCRPGSPRSASQFRRSGWSRRRSPIRRSASIAAPKGLRPSPAAPPARRIRPAKHTRGDSRPVDSDPRRRRTRRCTTPLVSATRCIRADEFALSSSTVAVLNVSQGSTDAPPCAPCGVRGETDRLTTVGTQQCAVSGDPARWGGTYQAVCSPERCSWSCGGRRDSLACVEGAGHRGAGPGRCALMRLTRLPVR